MANITSISNPLFDTILPTFGSVGNNLPVWNEGQKMFIFSEYESEAGNRYYKGLRFCNQLAIVEIVGLYHTWTYIDGVEIYAFNGKNTTLINKRQFEKKFYDAAFIREQVEQMVKDYVQGQLKMQDTELPAACIDQEVKNIIGRSYTSFLSDEFNDQMMKMIPLLCASNGDASVCNNKALTL